MAKRGRPRKNIEFETLTEELNEAHRNHENLTDMYKEVHRSLMSSEAKVEELLEEIRMYERENSTLRHIIIDALKGRD